MLWENDGSATDVVNVITEEVGDGTIMDAFRRHLTATADSKKADEIALQNAIAARVNECERRAEDETGLIPDFSIPIMHYHGYAFEFKLKAAEMGITLESNGYECWYCPDFTAWYKKKHPEQCFKEAKRAASIIVPATKYSATTGEAQAAGAHKSQFTHGGLIAA